MNLAGLHHVTMITGDAQENVRFYADLLGLRFVKKTVNFDAPEAYHLYFGDELGTPGSILTWFEFPGAARGSAASAGPTTPRPKRAACRAPAPSTTSRGPLPTTSSSRGRSGSGRPAATS